MNEDDEDEDRNPEPDEDEFPTVDDLIGTFLTETSLLPIVVVVLGSGGAFGAALLILTAVDRNPFAAGALVLLAGMTVDVCLRARKEARFRNIALLIGMVWASAVVLAGVAVWSGIAFG
jgi:hypothetical protein